MGNGESGNVDNPWGNPWRRCKFGNGWTIYFGSNDSICLFWTFNFIYKSELFRQYYKCQEGITLAGVISLIIGPKFLIGIGG